MGQASSPRASPAAEADKCFQHDENPPRTPHLEQIYNVFRESAQSPAGGRDRPERNGVSSSCRARRFFELNDKIAEENLTDEFVWNADQSGFQYEMIRNRTLTFKGEKLVEARVTDDNAISHSYSIQVHLSKSGVLGSKLFICFQETTGSDFGPRVQQQLTELLAVCSNVAVSCSKSGKLSSALMQR